MDDRSKRLKNTKKTFNVNDLLFWVKEDATSQTHVKYLKLKIQSDLKSVS